MLHEEGMTNSCLMMVDKEIDGGNRTSIESQTNGGVSRS